MKKTGRGWNGIPAGVREELGLRGRAFYLDYVSRHGLLQLGETDTLADNQILASCWQQRGTASSCPRTRGFPVARRQIGIC
jgi:hypothetical protein